LTRKIPTAAIIVALLAISLTSIAFSQKKESSSSPVSGANEPTISFPYVRMFQIQQNSTDFSPWLLYPASHQTVWAVVWGYMNNTKNMNKMNTQTLASQLVNFTLGVPQHRSAVIVNAVPNDIVYDNNTKRVWVLENDSLAYYNATTNNLTIAWNFPANSGPAYMTIDNNDQLWITLSGTNQIVDFQVGREPHSYNITDSCIQTTLGCGLWGITIDPRDGSIWFAEAYAGRIGHLSCNTSASCSLTYYAPPSSLNLYGLVQVAVAENGIVWFTVHEGNEFGSLNPSNGVWLLFPTGYCAEDCVSSLPNALSIDSQGQLWFAEHIAGKIGRYDPNNGELVEYTIPTSSNFCGNVCTPLSWWMWPGPDHLVWFVAYGLGDIGYVNSTAPISLTAATSAGSVTVPQGGSAALTVSATYAGEAPSINAIGTSLDVSSSPPMLSFSVGPGRVSTGEEMENSMLTISAAWGATLGSRYIAASVYNANITVNMFVRVDVVTDFGAYTTIGFAGGISIFTAATVSINWLSKKKRNNGKTRADATSPGDGGSVLSD
jgi:streptogramin lyase